MSGGKPRVRAISIHTAMASSLGASNHAHVYLRPCQMRGGSCQCANNPMDGESLKKSLPFRGQ
eukprot:scaffold39964_cov50-Attheya_sp.AAC.3